MIRRPGWGAGAVQRLGRRGLEFIAGETIKVFADDWRIESALPSFRRQAQGTFDQRVLLPKIVAGSLGLFGLALDLLGRDQSSIAQTALCARTGWWPIPKLPCQEASQNRNLLEMSFEAPDLAETSGGGAPRWRVRRKRSGSFGLREGIGGRSSAMVEGVWMVNCAVRRAGPGDFGAARPAQAGRRCFGAIAGRHKSARWTACISGPQ